MKHTELKITRRTKEPFSLFGNIDVGDAFFISRYGNQIMIKTQEDSDSNAVSLQGLRQTIFDDEKVHSIKKLTITFELHENDPVMED